MRELTDVHYPDAECIRVVQDNLSTNWPGALYEARRISAPAYPSFFGLAGDDAKLLTGPLALTLAAISAGASYFGAMTYIGNAPNLMVKSIVESHGVTMPELLRLYRLVRNLPAAAAVGVRAVFFR